MTLPQDPSLGTDCSTSRSWRRQETVFPRDREYNAVLHHLSFYPAPPVSHSNLRKNLIHFPCLFGYSQSSTRLHQVKRQHYMNNTEKVFYTGGGVSRSALTVPAGLERLRLLAGKEGKRELPQSIPRAQFGQTAHICLCSGR